MKILTYEFSENNKIRALISQIKKREEKLKGLPVSTELFTQIFRHNYLKQAYSSTKIEYSLINFSTAKKVVYAKKAKNEEQQEVLNVANAHLKVSADLKKRVSDNFIIDVHRQISKDLKGSMTEPDYKAGRYRNVQNYLGDPFSNTVTYTFPGPKEVPKLMKSLNHFINKTTKLDKILFPGIFHFLFIAIHPFINGNGRTVRVLEDFLLKKTGYNRQNLYNLSEYYYENLKRYHYFLNLGRDGSDMTGFIEFYLEGISASQNKVFEEKALLERIEKLHELSEWRNMDKLDKKLLHYLAGKNELTIKKAVKLSSKKLTAEGLRLRFQKYIGVGIMKKTGGFKDAKYIWNE